MEREQLNEEEGRRLMAKCREVERAARERQG